ncbi:phage tail tape measure protein [Kitasatospora sp. NPDC001175]|uniref:phage tail tape measure protein n=1 Tax=Kitasatospora sp. NPDC001175 TaxID=3157103 RepID=UPI003D0475C1
MSESFLPPVIAEIGANAAPFTDAMATAIEGLQGFAAAAEETGALVTEAFAAMSRAAEEMAAAVSASADTAKKGIRQVASAARALTKAIDGLATSAPEQMAAIGAAATEMATTTAGAFARVTDSAAAASTSIKAAAASADGAAVTTAAAAGKTEAAAASSAKASETAFGSAAAGLKKYAAGLGIVGGAVLFEAIKGATSFEAEMTRVNTQAGVAKSQLGILGDGVLQLAGQLGENPDSLAESLLHVESNFESLGISAPKALELVKIAGEGAKVGGADLVDVTNALTAAVAANIPGVEDLNQAMGALNAIVGTGDMKMQDLANAFGTGMVASVKGYGLSITDVGAALATFGDNNIRGAQAGTQLRMAVQSLAVPVSGAKEWLDKFGMTSHTLAQDMQKGGLKLALEDLTEHFKKAGITADQQGDVITEMFGKKAGTGLSILLGQMDRVESKYPAITEGADKFGTAWQSATQTMSMHVDQLKAGIEALAIKIGEALLPYVEKFLTWIQQGVGWLTQHKGAVQALAGAVGGVLVGAIVALGTALTSALLTPAGAIVAAATALGAAFVYTYNHSRTFRTAMNDLGRFLAGAFKVAWTAAATVIHWFASTVLPVLKAAIQAVFGWFEQHKQVFIGAWNVMAQAVRGIVQWFNANVLTWIKARVAELVAWWTEHSQQIHEVWSAVWKIVETAVKVWWDGVMRPTLAIIQSVWTVVWGVIKDTIKIVWDVISGVVMTGIHFVENTIGLVLDILTGKWGKVWGDLSHLVGQALDDVVTTIGHIASGFGNLLWDAGANIVRGLINGIRSMVGGVGRAISDVASTIRSYLPFSPAKVGPLSGSGSPDLAGAKIGTMVADGIHASVGTVSAATGRLAGAASLTAGGPAFAGTARTGLATPLGNAAGAPTYVVNVTVQGSVHSERDLRDVIERQMYQLGMRGSTTWQNYARR